MSCNCNHGALELKFPVFAPQPMGPAERWPVYFVPVQTYPGMGYYFCPCCMVGLDAAREMTGMPPLVIDQPPLTRWGRFMRFLQDLRLPETYPNSPAIHSR